MAISNDQRIDYLIKKVGFGVAKTDIFDNKGPSNEALSSPLLNRADTLWTRSQLIPQDPPTSDTQSVGVYTGVNRIECVVDTTATPNRTWLTNLEYWIPTEFGANYQVTVYIDDQGATNPSITGTKIFPSGSGNNDSWFFDYQAGSLNFPDTNIPSGLTTGKSIFVEGYRYIGEVGLESLISTLSEGPFDGDLTGSVFADNSVLLVDGVSGKLVLEYNTTDDLPEGNTNQYYTPQRTRKDSRIIALIFGS